MIVPSKQEMYLILGAKVSSEFVNTEKGNVLVDKSYQALLTHLDNIIDENTNGNKKDSETTQTQEKP